MRLAEKSVEVNFCTQLSFSIGRPCWWFGLTQRQEAAAGWDVATKIDGWWLRFQLKASNRVLKSGVRQFRANHDQLDDLRARATTPGRVFYVLPTIGSTSELTAVGFDLLSNIRLLDVHDLHAVGAPTTAAGALRKSREHYIDLHASGMHATVHSDPVTVGLTHGYGVGDLIGTALVPERIERASAGTEASREFLAAGRHRVALLVPA